AEPSTRLESRPGGSSCRSCPRLISSRLLRSVRGGAASHHGQHSPSPDPRVHRQPGHHREMESILSEHYRIDDREIDDDRQPCLLTTNSCSKRRRQRHEKQNDHDDIVKLSSVVGRALDVSWKLHHSEAVVEAVSVPMEQLNPFAGNEGDEVCRIVDNETNRQISCSCVSRDFLAV